MNWWEGLLYLASMPLIAVAGLWAVEYAAAGCQRPRWRDVLDPRRGWLR